MIKSAPGGRYACNVIDNALLKLEEHRQEIAEDRLQHFLDTWPQQFADRDPDNEALGSLVTFFAQKDNTVQTSPSDISTAQPHATAAYTAVERLLEELCRERVAASGAFLLFCFCAGSTLTPFQENVDSDEERWPGAWRMRPARANVYVCVCVRPVQSQFFGL